MTSIQIEARPYTSPCATCNQPIPEELNILVFVLAGNPAATLCDTCARKADPAAYAALADLRRIDAAYFGIFNRDGLGCHPAAEKDAAAYLTTLTDGLRVMTGMYLDGASDGCPHAYLTEALRGRLDDGGRAA